MRRLVGAIGYLSILWLLTSCMPHNPCSSKDRTEMEHGGFSTDEINSACTNYRISDDFIKAAVQVAQIQLKDLSAAGASQFASLMSSHNPNYIRVKVFYGTDRKALIGQYGVTSYGAERGSLAVGVSEVSIPLHHRLGSLESPSVWKLEFRPDPAKHVAVLSVSPMSLEHFRTALNGTIPQPIPRSAFIFIHGYNMSFDDALRRTAQIAYDLDFKGIPILYSWPSNGAALDYLADGEQARRAAGYLRSFIEFVIAKTDLQEVHLIAHSMGNRVLTAALQQPDFQSSPSVIHLGQIALVAPDIDAEIFTREIAPSIIGFGRRLSLYASKHDRALILSKSLQHYPRAGDLSEVVTIIDGMDTIDASSVDTSLMGHSYYAENRSVISDLFHLLRTNTPPADRFGMQPLHASGRRYWRFAP